MDAGSAGNVDDGARLAVLDPEVRCRCSDQLEGCGAVEGEDGVPLLIGSLGPWSAPGTMIALRTQWSNLVNHTVPSEAGVVDNDVDLALAKLCRLLHKLTKVIVI